MDSEILSAIGLAVGSRTGGDFFRNIIDNPFDLYKYYTRNSKRATAERELENIETSLLLIQIQQQKGKNER